MLNFLKFFMNKRQLVSKHNIIATMEHKIEDNVAAGVCSLAKKKLRMLNHFLFYKGMNTFSALIQLPEEMTKDHVDDIPTTLTEEDLP